MSTEDTFGLVIDEVRQMLPGIWVADRLPFYDQLDEQIPCVVIDTLPGNDLQAFGGDVPLVISERVVLDVEVYAKSRLEAQPVADMLRAALYQLPHLAGNPISYVDCPRFVTRDERNPHVRVLGQVVELTVRPTYPNEE